MAGKPWQRLTRDQINEMVSLQGAKLKQVEISKIMGIKLSTVQAILVGRNYAWLTGIKHDDHRYKKRPWHCDVCTKPRSWGHKYCAKHQYRFDMHGSPFLVKIRGGGGWHLVEEGRTTTHGSERSCAA